MQRQLWFVYEKVFESVSLLLCSACSSIVTDKHLLNGLGKTRTSVKPAQSSAKRRVLKMQACLAVLTMFKPVTGLCVTGEAVGRIGELVGSMGSTVGVATGVDVGAATGALV